MAAKNRSYPGVTALGQGRYLLRGKYRSVRTGRTHEYERIVSAKSAAQAAQQRAALKAQLAAQGMAPARTRLIDYAQQWLVSLEPEVAEQTLQGYTIAIASLCRLHGEVFVDAVTRTDLIGWRQGLLDQGLSPRTVNTYLGIVRRLFAAASDDLELRDPCRRIRGVPTGQAARRPLTTAELRALLQAAERLEPTHRSRLPLTDLITLLACSGLRIGEALALRWEDVDLDGAAITLARTQLYGRKAVGEPRRSTRDPREQRTGPLKGRRPGEVRIVPLPAVLQGLLASRRALLVASGRPVDGWVFAARGGRMHDYYTVGKAFARVADAAGLPGISPHYLRHTAVNAARRCASDVIVVQAMVGHANSEMTALYSKVSHEEKLAVSEAAAALLLGGAGRAGGGNGGGA